MAGGSVLATLGTGLATWLGFRRERVKIAQEHAEWLHKAEHKMRDGISARLSVLQDRYGRTLDEIVRLRWETATCRGQLAAVYLWRCPLVAQCPLFPGTGRPTLPIELGSERAG
jgi:hypothetical protein